MGTRCPYSRSTAPRVSLPRSQRPARSSRSTWGAYSGRDPITRRTAGLRPASSKAGRGAAMRKESPSPSSRTSARPGKSSFSRPTRKQDRRSSPPAPWAGQVRIRRRLGRAQI